MSHGQAPAADDEDGVYCHQALDALKRLEENSYRRNQARRDFDKKVNRRRTVYSTIVALVLPVIVWVYFLTATPGTVHLSQLGADARTLTTRTFGLVAVSVFLFLIVFFTCTFFWESTVVRPVRKLVERGLKADYLAERATIDAAARQILSERYFTEERIPEKYLSTQMVSLLIRFFDSGQATFMEAAVYMLDMELANSAYYRNIVPTRTLVAAERAQIAEDEQEGGASDG
jgi:hypothetical protein